MAEKQIFEVVLEKHPGMEATGITVPFDVEKVFGAKRVPVKVWVNGVEHRSTVCRMGGKYMMAVPKRFRDPAGIKAGDMITVEMERDTEERTVEIPKDFEDAMKKAGVMGATSISYIDVVMDDNSSIPQTQRLLVTHKVKDWNAWKKEFDDHKQARMDAGLIDRALGYTSGDNHDVSIVFAVTDMAKAKAFIASKDLKDKMTQAGVEGPPSFFFYDIVQKYQ